MRFEKNTVIAHQKKSWRCICADDEAAVFGLFSTNGIVHSTDCTQVFVVANFEDFDDFEYQSIGKIEDGHFINENYKYDK